MYEVETDDPDATLEESGKRVAGKAEESCISELFQGAGMSRLREIYRLTR